MSFPSSSSNVQYGNRRRSAPSHSTPNSPTKARNASRASTEALCTCMTADPSLLGSKFAPYGKDGCSKEDQSDNSVMSNRSLRNHHRVSRVNSSDSQCYFEDSTSRPATSSSNRATLQRSNLSKESKRARSRSTDHLPNMINQHHPAASHTELNSLSIRKMLRPVHTAPDSPVTSPENARHNKHPHHHGGVQSSTNTLKKGVRGKMSSQAGCMSEPEFFDNGRGPSKARSEQRINGYDPGLQPVVLSPASDEVDIFDSHCFATTPSSSNASDNDEPASPTSQLLMEYEEHLRNTLEKDSESYSLHTFEALLSRSMENLGKIH